MEASDPRKVPLPRAPLSVEDSRAKRHQRQQSRFRDRGGIFVPTTRTTLIDILLGRKAASPKKARARSRSVSLSPKKKGTALGSDSAEGVKTLRTSPRKAAQRQPEEVIVAGPSKLPPGNITETAPNVKRKPTKDTAVSTVKTTTTSNKKDKGKAKTGGTEKPPAKRRGRPPKSKAPKSDDEDADVPIPDHQPKTKPKRVTKGPKKLATKKKPDYVDTPVQIIDEREPPKCTSGTKAKCRPTNNLSKPHTKTSKLLAPTSKLLLDTILESNAEDTPSMEQPHVDTSRSRNGSANPRNDEEDNKVAAHMASKKAAKRQSTTAVKGTHTEKVHILKPMSSKSTTGDSDIVTPPLNVTTRSHNNSPLDYVVPETTGKRSRDASTDMEKPAKPKRAKTASKEANKPLLHDHPDIAKTKTRASRQTKNISIKAKRASTKDDAEDEPPALASSRKRARPCIDEADVVKRAKIATEDPTADPSTNAQDGKTVLKKVNTRKLSIAKTSAEAKVPKSTKSSSKAKPGSKVLPVTKLRPRKSVMRRIKEPLPPIKDDDPDPINFLC